ncbi:MAG: tetratricopeptide repeat protein [Gemmatimonadetes bacterium]|uniref:Tetratricopeptide repeat protein n=1 Tax=Candidatus Kutchimonas denitrificans TaxID=3056748 RepID=A0AAE4Z636_9BACT|nr:tetratricopeptide repeat protein [Gemmatimonadota bacterium]NIR74044.1 tetratricopeptide repeat protein [Candidatus Kutchimonas denitrificans]NIS03033.1 tetratricopeptide repeat protein [Gemmatimonadota bacterium]NIT68750.1 tetratricopeptide repeat protein [Gemmatimonadota bacterium]NIU53331.1 tetratricopeptide repeat protein [Gemmatimonadota bacterium]
MGQLLLAYDLSHAAEPALLNAASLAPNDARWAYYLAHLYWEEGEPEPAVHYLERTLELDPDYTPARMGLAKMYLDLGRETEAEALLNESLRRNPDNAFAHLLLGHLAASDDPRRAIEHYETVLRLQPEASVVHYPLALAYRRAGDVDRSREHMMKRGGRSVPMPDPLADELTRIRKGPGARIAYGNELVTRGQFAQAAREFEAALAADSTNVSAHLDLALALAQLGDFDQATEHLDQAIQLDPSNTHALYSMGLVVARSGANDGPQRAGEYFRRAIAADPGNAAARLALANLLWRQGDCREAIDEFENVLAEASGNIEARIRQAVCHAHVEQYSRARELLESGHEAWPDEPRIKNALVRIPAASPDRRVRDGERAVALAEELAAAYRQVPVFEGLAMAYAEQGRFEEAVGYQQQVVAAAEAQNARPEMIDYLRENLRLYQRERPSRTPWPPAVFRE